VTQKDTLEAADCLDVCGMQVCAILTNNTGLWEFNLNIENRDNQ